MIFFVEFLINLTMKKIACKYKCTLDFLVNAVFSKHKLRILAASRADFWSRVTVSQFKWHQSEGAVISQFFCFFFWFYEKQNVEQHKVEIHELKSSALQKRTILNKCTSVKPPEINHENLKSSARLVSLKARIFSF